MKMKLFPRIMMLFVSFFMLITFQLTAQDVVKTNPNNTKLLTDTLGVRMIKVSLAPGEELVMHTHPVQMMYCLEGGQITVTFKDGKKEVMDIKSGDAMQAPPDPPHVTKNTGKTKVVFLQVEIADKKK